MLVGVAVPVHAGSRPTPGGQATTLAPAPQPRPEDEAPPPSDDDPDRERILRLQEALHSLVHGPVLGRVRTAIRVTEARSGRVLFTRRADLLMDPASNQKILATAAALLRLGNQFRYRTEVTGAPPDETGLVPGDLVLRGGGDPSLDARALESLATALVARGVRRVAGDVVADRRYLGVDDAAPGARPPLSVSRSALVVRVRPGAQPRGRPQVTYEPALEGIVVANQATTVARGRTRITVTVGSQGGRIVVTVRGRISQRQAGVVFRRRPNTPMLYAAALLLQALERRGVKIDGGAVVREATAPASGARPSEMLAQHLSAPLPALMRPINKISNNDYADRLLETLGAQVYGGVPSMAEGVRALREALAELGMPDSAYHSTNGSGLGHENRLSPHGLTELLRTLYFDPRIGPEILQSLSVGGVDGTTKHRFAGSVAAHRVRAKTGTLNGKSCLSGYVGDESEILVFSIMVDHIRRRGVNAVRKAQVRVVEALMGYAQGLVNEPTDEQAEPGADFEVGDDVIETEEEETLPGLPTEGGSQEGLQEGSEGSEETPAPAPGEEARREGVRLAPTAREPGGPARRFSFAAG
ncbi:MAG: D-alanyl-D-alanine carboxypeptidase/D-alanyl-D-alanine-endopeptidase [Myxococcales bacterium]|nr:D-alanyl-D-alanine carboxypeptidase/D-alanyl-D-alanine-endopeptidase [Myxococcales bacterium]